jgi:hypothetical protein
MGNGTVAVETLLVFGLRGGFFLLASRYLKRALFADLRQVIHDETSLNTTSAGGSSPTSGSIHLPAHGGGSSHDSSDEFDSSSPVGNGNGQSLRDQLYNLRSASISSASILPTSAHPGSTTRLGSASPPGPNSRVRRASLKKGNSAAGAPKLAGAVFCLSVSECSTLFALILFGYCVNLFYRSRLWNWNLSLGAVLSIIVLVVPLGMCLLMTLRQRGRILLVPSCLHIFSPANSHSYVTATSNSLRKTAMFTALPFLLYLFGLYEIGEWIATLFGVEQGSHTFGE